MRNRVPHNMSLNFSIDRILSPDFGPRKSRAIDSITDTCSVNGSPVNTPQGLCKTEDFSYKKLLTDPCKNLEMPTSPKMRANADLMSIISGTDLEIFGAGKSELDALKNGTTDFLMLPRRFADQCDLENLNQLGTPSDYFAAKSCLEKQSEPLTKVFNFIEDIIGQKAQDFISGKNFLPPVGYSEIPKPPISFRSPGAEQNRLLQLQLPAGKTAAFSTKETSPAPRKFETCRSLRDSQQPLTHQEEDLLQTDEAEISCDTKPQVPEELLQNDDRCLSADGRCSSSSVDTLSSTVGSESNHDAPITHEKLKPEPTRTVIKESLSDDCVDSPPTTFSDSNVQQSFTPNHKLLSDDLGGVIPPEGKEWPVWVFCNRYSARPSSGPRSRRQSKKVQPSDEKRCRTAFTNSQLSRLHLAFESNHYLCEKRRNELARDLQLSESQVKIWFQNRRAKVKKATGTKNPLADLLKEQGLYNHSTTRA